MHHNMRLLFIKFIRFKQLMVQENGVTAIYFKIRQSSFVFKLIRL